MITVSAEEMRSAVKLCCGATSPNNPAPILQHLKLQTNEKRLRISGTNMIQSIMVEIDCETRKPVAACVNAARLSGILTSASGSIVIANAANAANKPLTLSFGATNIKLASLPAEDFPVLLMEQDASAEQTLMASAKDMKAVFAAASLASAREDTRNALNGICLGSGRVVATNGHWLFTAKQPFSSGINEIDVIIPISATKALVALAESSRDAPVRVRINRSFAEFSNGKETLLSKLVDERYPDWNRVLSGLDKNRVSVRVRSSEMLAAIRHIRPALEHDASKKTPMIVSVDKGKLLLSIFDKDNNGGEETIGLDGENDGKSAKDAVNIVYMMDAVNALYSEEINLSFGEKGSPIKMSTPNSDDRVVILMPMRF